MKAQELSSLLREILSLGGEREWVEYKRNWFEPDTLGEYVSALSNSAALKGQFHGYFIWGIDDVNHDVVGTDFRFRDAKKGNEEYENHLARCLSPRIDFRHYCWKHEGCHVEMLKVDAAKDRPVAYKGEQYIRVGTSKQNLKGYPEKARQIWTASTPASFESAPAADNLTPAEVLNLLDYEAFYRLLQRQRPHETQAIISDLNDEDIIVPDGERRWTIPNSSALILARELTDFSHLKRKSTRLIFYSGKDKLEAEREIEGVYGYAVGFEGLIDYIMDRLPQNEVIESALRAEVKMYPRVAIRELIANALIHQDFSQSGTQPMIELYEDRIEITNNGTPLINPLRFIDEVPRSRNEAVAGLMRKLHICEERGSGVKRTVAAIETHQLPPPDFRERGSHTQAVLYAHQPLSEMEKKDKVRACYQHACLKYALEREAMTNASLRNRFELDDSKNYVASRIISDTVEDGFITALVEKGRGACYVPFWVEAS